MADLKYFMWGWQQEFLFNYRALMRNMLGELDRPLEHYTFLLGFRVTSDGRFRRVCVEVEPEECRYQPFLFDGIYKDAMESYARPPSTTEPGGSENWEVCGDAHDGFLRKLKEGVLEVLRKNTDEAALTTYSTFPCQVNKNYVVCLVLQIARNDYEALPHLQKSVSEDEHGRKYHIEPSFMSSVVSAFLKDCQEEISKREPGQIHGRQRDPKEFLREAGRNFMYTASATGKEFKGLHGMFEACNIISSLQYEGAEGAGHIVVAAKDHPALDVRIEFTDPPKLAEYRAIRKLLQLCDKDTWLLSNSYHVYGLGGVKPGAYDPSLENLFAIRFVKHHCWELTHDGHALMQTIYGEPRFPKPIFDEERLNTMLQRVIPGVTPAATEELIALARTASEAKHGTMLVISSDAAGEAVRLEKQALRIRPRKLSGDQLAMATSIDGAILLDATASCHAIGVILDGRASPNGTPSRGARYNSAVRYAEEKGTCSIDRGPTAFGRASKLALDPNRPGTASARR